MPNGITLIYTRFSSDMQREDSCADQERNVRQALGHKGIDHSTAIVINDQAESGTKSDRAGFTRMCEMVKRGEVGIVAVDDQSRLSRGDNAFSFIQDLVYAGGRFISTGEGIDTIREGWELSAKMMEVHNSTTIREIARRVHRGQKGRVLDGDGSAGDLAYGYASEYIDPSAAVITRRGPKPKKRVIINEDEAQWVRQVFAWFNEGRSMKSIVRELNGRKVNKGGKSTKPGWHHFMIRRILVNKKYIGIWTWGLTVTKRNSKGKTKQVPADPADVVVRQRPTLRIVAQETWDAAQTRLNRLNDAYGHKPGQNRRGPRIHHTALYPSKLLSGLLFCGGCGARLVCECGGSRNYYGCSNHKKGLCKIAYRAPQSLTENVLLDFLSKMLSEWPEWMQQTHSSLQKSIADAAQQVPETVEADERKLSKIQKQLDHLVDALAAGSQQSQAIVARVKQMESESETLQKRIADARRLISQPIELPNEAWLRTQMQNLGEVLRAEPGPAALVLREIIGKVTIHEVLPPGKKKGYGRMSFKLSGRALIKKLASTVPANLVPANGETASPEIQLDLGGPTRYDRWAPEIDNMRKNGIAWNQIGRVTGLGSGNACNAWKRWRDPQSGTA